MSFIALNTSYGCVEIFNNERVKQEGKHRKIDSERLSESLKYY